MTKFEKNIKMVFSESQYDLCMNNRKTNSYYKQLNDEYNKLFDRVHNILGKKHGKLMLKLQELRNEKEGLEDDMVYLQGLYDCVKLLKMIKII